MNDYVTPDTVRDVLRHWEQGRADRDPRLDDSSWKGRSYAADRGVRIVGWHQPPSRKNPRGKRNVRRAADMGCPNLA